MTIYYMFDGFEGDFEVDNQMIAEAVADTFKRNNNDKIKDNRESNSLELFIEECLHDGSLGEDFIEYWEDDIKDYWQDDAEAEIYDSLDDEERRYAGRGAAEDFAYDSWKDDQLTND